MCFLCILIPVLVGLICALLGYLLGRHIFKPVADRLREELAICSKEKEDQLKLFNSLKTEHDDLKIRYNALQSDFADYRIRFATTLPEDAPFDEVMAASVFRKKIVRDDLKIVEGIGPKIEELFHSAGIMTWKDLASAAVERCQQILDAAGDNFRIHKPDTWPKQSELAYLGKWAELKEWQDSMTGGKE